jgi:hypothetical protein
MSRLIVTNVETQNIKFDSDTTAFTIGSDGVLSGTGSPSMVKLLDDTISSAVAQYDISSTHMNSTYDDYVLYATLLPASDGVNLIMSVFENGSVLTGDKYSFECSANSSSTYLQSNSVHRFGLNVTAAGNAAGEGITAQLRIHNVNSTTHSFCYGGEAQSFSNGAAPNGQELSGSLLVSERNVVVNGLRISFESGNIASGTIKLYGIK